jgi:hypothetical protein
MLSYAIDLEPFKQEDFNHTQISDLLRIEAPLFPENYDRNNSRYELCCSKFALITRLIGDLSCSGGCRMIEPASAKSPPCHSREIWVVSYLIVIWVVIARKHLRVYTCSAIFDSNNNKLLQIVILFVLDNRQCRESFPDMINLSPGCIPKVVEGI